MRINAVPKCKFLGFETGWPDYETTALPTELSRFLEKLKIMFVCFFGILDFGYTIECTSRSLGQSCSFNSRKPETHF